MFGLDLGVIAVALLGLLGAIGAAFFKGRSTGKASEVARQREASVAARDEADAVDAAVAGQTADERREELDAWSR